MSKKNRLTPFILISVAVCLWSGCSKPGSETLAIVGDYEITTNEFNDFFRIRWILPTAQDEYDQKRIALDSLIEMRLLVQAAYEKNIDKQQDVSRVVLAYQDRFLIDALMQKEIADKAEPTEAEIKEFYNRLEYKVRASHIIVDNLDTAQVLLERIENGENFEKLAYDYSTDKSAKRNKGDLGYFVWGNMVEGFQQAAFSMEPGEVSPPVKSRYGYHIIKVVDRLPNELRTDFASMKRSLDERVRSSNMDRLGEKYYNQIKDKYVINIDTATCDYLLHKRQKMYPPQLLKNLPKNDFDLEQLDRNERELVLATWDGGQMSVYDYLNLVQKQVPSKIRPGFDDYDSLATIIFRIKTNDILAIEAHRSGIDNDPRYLDKLKRFKEYTMAETMKEDSIPLPPPPDEGMVRQYYDEHIEEFTIPAKVYIHEILLSDELKAQKFKKELKSLEAFKQTASELTERSGKRIGGGDLGWVRRGGYLSDLFDVAWKTPVGGIGGPVVLEGKHSIFYVVDKIDAQLKDYLGLKRDIAQKISNQQKKEAIEVWVAQRRESTRIVVNEDVLWATVDLNKYSETDTVDSSS